MFQIIRISDNKIIGQFKERATAEAIQTRAEVPTRLVYKP